MNHADAAEDGVVDAIVFHADAAEDVAADPAADPDADDAAADALLALKAAVAERCGKEGEEGGRKSTVLCPEKNQFSLGKSIPQLLLRSRDEER